MKCIHCGGGIPTGAAFCPHCGSKVESKRKILFEQANNVARHFVPAKLKTAFPTVKPLAFIVLYAIILFAAVSFISGLANGGMTGTYRTNEFFPVNQITFYENGKFSAVSYVGYTETYQGKYNKKLNGEYLLRFTGGSADGGSPVTQFEASSIGDQYELSVEKVNEQTLKVRVVPKIGYWAWGGTEVYFYRV